MSREYVRAGLGTASTTDNDIVYELNSQELLSYNVHYIQNIDAQNIDIDISLDGTNWSTGMPIQNTAGAAHASNQIGAGSMGVLRMRLRGIRVRNKGGTNSANCVVLHGLE